LTHIEKAVRILKVIISIKNISVDSWNFFKIKCSNIPAAYGGGDMENFIIVL